MNPYQTHTDPQLLSLLQQGKARAFEIIYQRYVADLFRYAGKIINHKEDAEEIIQDVFETLWHRRAALKIDSLRHYLFNAVRYQTIRYFNKKGIQKRYIQHYTIFAELYDAIEFTEEEDVNEIIRQKILHCLQDLSPRCRETFTLRMHEKLSNKQIAKRMQLSLPTVELYLYRAMAHLRANKEKFR